MLKSFKAGPSYFINKNSVVPNKKSEEFIKTLLLVLKKLSPMYEKFISLLQYVLLALANWLTDSLAH